MAPRRFRPELPLLATLFVVGAGGALWLLAQLSFALRAQRDWRSAPATVLEAELQERVVPRPLGRFKTRLVPRVFYAYEVDGRDYEGGAIAPLWLSFVGSDRYQAQALSGLAPLSKTTVRYDPRRPERSFLTLRFDGWLVAGWLALALGWAAAAGGAFGRALREDPAGAGRTPRAAALVAGAGLALMAGRYAALGEPAPSAWVAATALLAFALAPLLPRRAQGLPPAPVAPA